MDRLKRALGVGAPSNFIPILDTPEPIALRPGGRSQFAVDMAPSSPPPPQGNARSQMATEATPRDQHYSSLLVRPQGESTFSSRGRMAPIVVGDDLAGAPIASMGWASRAADARHAEEAAYERNEALRGREASLYYARQYPQYESDAVVFRRPEGGTPLSISHNVLLNLKPATGPLPPEMQRLRDHMTTPNGASVTELATERVATTQLHRPFVDERGVQYYEAHVSSPSASARPGGGGKSAGVPLQMQGRVAHAAHSLRCDDASVAPIEYRPANARSIGHHVYTDGQSAAIAHAVKVEAPDFNWSVDDPEEPKNFRSYLQSALIPHDDRVFQPNSAAARGFKPTTTAPGRGGGDGRHSPAVGGRSVSPPRFRVTGERSPSAARTFRNGGRASPEPPGGAVGLQIVDPWNVLPAQRYQHRGWSHLGAGSQNHQRIGISAPPETSARRAKLDAASHTVRHS